MDMGFAKSICKTALKKNRNNLEKSLEQLISNPNQFVGIDNSDDSSWIKKYLKNFIC